MTVTASDPTTVRAPIPRHVVTWVVAALAAVALVAALAIGFAVADSDSSPAVGDPSGAPASELPTRFGEGRYGSVDALERAAEDDGARRYGSPDAAEEHNR